MRIWIDTDIGSDVDDALALAYVLRHAGFELVGVSTVFGEVDLRARIAAELLAVADRSEVPVLPGLGVPRTPRRKGVMFGHEGKGIVAGANPRARVTEEDGGVERIEALAVAMTEAEPEVVLAIGPLTNLAALVDLEIELPRLAVMGGKFTDVMLENMVVEIGEWNWFCDPDAVRRVLAPALRHREPPLVVPADVTFRTHLVDGDVERLASGDALSSLVADQCRHWLDLLGGEFGRAHPRVALHDPLTAAVLVTPTLCTFEERRVDVDDKGSAASAEGEPNVEVAVDVDPEATRDHILSTIL